MSPHIGDREQEKLEESADGETTVRVTVAANKDSDGDKQQITSQGESLVQNMAWNEMYKNIIQELRKINIQLTSITSQEIEDVEDL
jgi:hypothetical protein